MLESYWFCVSMTKYNVYWWYLGDEYSFLALFDESPHYKKIAFLWQAKVVTKNSEVVTKKVSDDFYCCHRAVTSSMSQKGVHVTTVESRHKRFRFCDDSCRHSLLYIVWRLLLSLSWLNSCHSQPLELSHYASVQWRLLLSLFSIHKKWRLSGVTSETCWQWQLFYCHLFFL